MKKRIGQLCEGELFTLVPLEEINSCDYLDLKSSLWVRGKSYKRGKFICYKYFNHSFTVPIHFNKCVHINYYDLDDINSLFAVDK